MFANHSIITNSYTSVREFVACIVLCWSTLCHVICLGKGVLQRTRIQVSHFTKRHFVVLPLIAKLA